MPAPIALTMGDPAGVGPEITLRAWQAIRLSGPSFFIIADPSLYGDAAEVIPFYVAENWREATSKIGFAKAMEFSIDLDEAQYAALHDGRRVSNLDYIPNHEFVIDKIGRSDERQFQDIGIEYYRYIQ